MEMLLTLIPKNRSDVLRFCASSQMLFTGGTNNKSKSTSKSHGTGIQYLIIRVQEGVK